MSRIVHLATFLQGGAGGAIADLACMQHRAGHQVGVLTSATGEPGYEHYPHYFDRLRAGGVALWTEDSFFKRDPALNARALARLIAQYPAGTIDVIHAHAGVPAAIALQYTAAHPGPIVIQTQHGWGTRKTPEQARQDLETLKTVDAVIATSTATRSQLMGLGLEPQHVNAIPCGIAEKAAGEPPPAAHAMVTPLRDAGYAVVGCIGSVTPNKNQRIVIAALEHHPDLDVAVVFVGEGGDDLVALARARGVASRVAVAGYQPDAATWLPLFDAVVIPSLTEGQGVVALEAARARVPLVASDIPAFRELVLHGQTGWLFDPNDAGGLADRLDEATRCSPATRGRLTAAAHARFLAQGSLDVMVARHEALYQRLQARLRSRAS